jgi:hypothetical protein
MKTLLIVLPLLLPALPGTNPFAEGSDAHAEAASHQAPSPASPFDAVEDEHDSSAPCGMISCVDMVGCTGAGTAVGARAACLLTWTVAAPDDPALALEFQTTTRTSIPPPPRS